MFLHFWAANTEPIQLNVLPPPPDSICKYTGMLHLYSSQDEDFCKK